jgi:hypothetical protein
MIALTPFVVAASPQSGIKTLPGLVKEARARPGKLNYGSAGVGSVTHVVAALLLHNARIDVAHIPYKGMSDVSAALQGGQVDLMVAATPPPQRSAATRPRAPFRRASLCRATRRADRAEGGVDTWCSTGSASLCRRYAEGDDRCPARRRCPRDTLDVSETCRAGRRAGTDTADQFGDPRPQRDAALDHPRERHQGRTVGARSRAARRSGRWRIPRRGRPGTIRRAR